MYAMSHSGIVVPRPFERNRIRDIPVQGKELGGLGMLEAMVQARRLLADALRLLDTVNAPADLGAHVDFAIHRIDAVVSETLLRENAEQSLAK